MPDLGWTCLQPCQGREQHPRRKGAAGQADPGEGRGPGESSDTPCMCWALGSETEVLSKLLIAVIESQLCQALGEECESKYIQQDWQNEGKWGTTPGTSLKSSVVGIMPNWVIRHPSELEFHNLNYPGGRLGTSNWAVYRAIKTPLHISRGPSSPLLPPSPILYPLMPPKTDRIGG